MNVSRGVQAGATQQRSNAASVPALTRTTASAMTISIKPAGIVALGNVGSTGLRRTTAGNSCADCGLESVSKPARRSPRHLNNMFALIPCCCASFDTDLFRSHAAVSRRCLKETSKNRRERHQWWSRSRAVQAYSEHRRPPVQRAAGYSTFPEISRIVWPSLTVIRAANSVHSSSHQRSNGNCFRRVRTLSTDGAGATLTAQRLC